MMVIGPRRGSGKFFLLFAEAVKKEAAVRLKLDLIKTVILLNKNNSLQVQK